MKKELFRMQSICRKSQSNMSLDDYNLTVYEGDFICIWNSSRQNDYFSRFLAGADRIDSGHIYLNGIKTEIYDEKTAKQFGIVLLNYSVQVFDHLSVADNVFLFKEQQEEKQQQKAMLEKLLEDVSLDVNVHLPASRLTGYQKILLQLAIALKFSSRLIVINEDSLYLKAEESVQLRHILQNLMENHGISFAAVSSSSEAFLPIAKSVQYVHRGADLMQWSIEEFRNRKKKSEIAAKEYVVLDSGIQIFVSDRYESIYDKAFDCAKRKEWKDHIGCEPLPYGEVCRKDIVYIPDIKKDILFDNLSLEDNISVNLGNKIGRGSGLLNRRMQTFLTKEFKKTVQMEEKPEEIRTLPILLRKQIAIKRWCVLRPAFLFIDEVFSELTVEESEAMLSYLETEQKNGVNIVLFINMQEMNSLLNAINGTV